MILRQLIVILGGLSVLYDNFNRDVRKTNATIQNKYGFFKNVTKIIKTNRILFFGFKKAAEKVRSSKKEPHAELADVVELGKHSHLGNLMGANGCIMNCLRYRPEYS